MKKKLHLRIASDHLRMDLLEVVRSTSLPMACRMFWAYLRGKERGYYQVVSSETINGHLDTNTVLPTLEKALNQLEISSHKKIAGSVLEVELGPMLARVGLLEVDGGGSARLTASDLDTYAHAWVRQTWGIDPADYAIKLSPLMAGSRYVLVCVSQMLIQQIAQLCSTKGLKFIECKPALVTFLSQARVQTTPAIMVFTEQAVDIDRGQINQLVVIDESGPLSISRFWTETADLAGRDDQITHAVRRLKAQHRFREEPEILSTQWPPAEAANSGGST